MTQLVPGTGQSDMLCLFHVGLPRVGPTRDTYDVTTDKAE